MKTTTIENATKKQVHNKLAELQNKEGHISTEIIVTEDKIQLDYVIKVHTRDEHDCYLIEEVDRTSFVWDADDYTIDKCKKPMCSSVYRFGVEMIQNCLENVSMKTLYDTMFVFSNASFPHNHRDKHLSCLDWILDDDASDSLWASVTYGTRPASECTYAIGDLTGRKRDNYEIYHFLLIEKKSELKKWVLENHNFTDNEKRLLHYFRDGGAE